MKRHCSLFMDTRVRPYVNTNLPAQFLGLVNFFDSSTVGQEDVRHVVANRLEKKVGFLLSALVCRFKTTKLGNVTRIAYA